MTALVSGLAGPIESLLEFKRAIGLPYQAGRRHLQAFDAMCAAGFPGQCVLTREMAMAWATARPSEHVNGQMRRITPVRQLARHMARLGVEAYVIPAGIPGRQVRYRPHIFTHDQLRALFAAADRIQPSPYGGRRDLVIPMLFRMIYCLGLRPGEARRLARNDVDLSGGTVYVRESKGHKDRRVYVSADLHGYCRTFDAAIGAHHPDRAPFFPNRKGQFYSHCSVNAWFGELLQAAGIRPAAGAPPPRPYDLRHAHVIETINRLARAGQNPEALLPYLSLHLGHSNPEDTWYYFHLAADFHPDLRRLANTGIEPALPEVRDGVR